jgi:uncharacterized protein YdaU (DUF1376 family)
VNQYLRHIGDWKAATASLTRVQRDIYSSLIDTYYDKERQLDGDFAMLAEDHGCRTEEELAALRYILKRYFRQTAEGYHNERADEEIAAFHHRIEAAQRAGKASGSARAQRKMNGKVTPVPLVFGDPNATAVTVESGSNNSSHRPTENTQKTNEVATDVQRKFNASSTPWQQNSNGTSTETQLPDDPITQHSSPAGEGGESASPAAPQPPHASSTAPEAPKPPDAPTPLPPSEKSTQGPVKPSRKAPKGFMVTPELVQWATKECPLLSVADIERETGTFKDHTFGRAISDWVGAWRNWLRKEQKYREARGMRPPVVSAKDAERERVLKGLYGNKELNNGNRRHSDLDVEARVVRDSEGDGFPSDEGAG